MPPDGEEQTVLPANLRFLKGLVTVLTAVMILGVLTIVALLVIRLNAEPARVVIDPGAFRLPEGVHAVGISVIEGRTVIVGDDGVIRVYNREDQTLQREIAITE